VKTENTSKEARLDSFASLYEKAKNALREFAWNFDYNFSRFTWYYDELAYMQGFFEEYGKRYGLYTEFHENAIC
jgi:hypothetical protein